MKYSQSPCSRSIAARISSRLTNSALMWGIRNAPSGVNSDPDFAAHWDVVARDQRRICRQLIKALHREGLLADPWTIASATDLLWTLMSNALMENLTIDCGWSSSRYTGHLATLMRAVFVAGAGLQR